MVRLEGSKPIDNSDENTSFNSSMVRLEEVKAAFGGNIPFVFQFHFGSIGSQGMGSTKGIHPEFQFHFGSIGSWLNNPATVVRFSFQFHFGSIGSKTHSHRAAKVVVFQFHFGSIGSIS